MTIDAFATATEMLAALRTKQVSAVELLELHARRIARHNPALNAIVEPDFDRARDEATTADARRQSGDDAPLLGLPMTLKESINVRGLRTTAGMTHWKDFRSEHDAPVTTRVKAAGAAVMGKTNVPQMLADWQSSNPVYGRTNNPWDRSRTPGGSTGGGAAALAAGLTPLALGDHRDHFALYLTLLAAVTSARVPAEQRAERLAVMRTRDDEWSRALQRGIGGSAPDYVAWGAQRERYRDNWRAFFREWDVLL